MKFLSLLLLFSVGFAVCGDKICETSEIGNCRDCAMINSNYICDNFENSLKIYDPDCNTTIGQTCYNSLFLYSSGKGNSCFPGNCTEGIGCITTCSENSQCTSGFCVGGTCQATCDDCDKATANYEVEPMSSTIFLGEPTFVSFRINQLSGSSTVAISANGPCKLTYEPSLTLIGGYGISVVKINSCTFSGLSSINLTAGDAYSAIHFLSYPALLYSMGEDLEGGIGFAPISGKINDVPVEVKVWIN